MVLRFGKLYCLGDDLMLVELLGQHAPSPDAATVERWASRTQGVGFRRLVLIEIPRQCDADFRCRVLDRNGRELDARVADICAALFWIHDQKLSNQPRLALQCRQGLVQASLCEQGWVAVDIEDVECRRRELQQLPEMLQRVLLPSASGLELAGQDQQLLIWSETPPQQRLPRLLGSMGRRLRGWQLLWLHGSDERIQVQHWQQERSEDAGDPVLLVAGWLGHTLQRKAVRVGWQQDSLLLELGDRPGSMKICAAVNRLFEGQVQA